MYFGSLSLSQRWAILESWWYMIWWGWTCLGSISEESMVREKTPQRKILSGNCWPCQTLQFATQKSCWKAYCYQRKKRRPLQRSCPSFVPNVRRNNLLQRTILILHPKPPKPLLRRRRKSLQPPPVQNPRQQRNHHQLRTHLHVIIWRIILPLQLPLQVVLKNPIILFLHPQLVLQHHQTTTTSQMAIPPWPPLTIWIVHQPHQPKNYQNQWWQIRLRWNLAFAMGAKWNLMIALIKIPWDLPPCCSWLYQGSWSWQQSWYLWIWIS